MVYREIDSPIGKLMLAGDEAGLRVLAFVNGRMRPPERSWAADSGELDSVQDELDAYFGGTLRRFTTRLAPRGTTFQRKVWAGLLEIPYGETISYGALAQRIGEPSAVRAVGAANGANPIAIIVPCHRVIGATGSLTGFGGGLPIKKALLELERGERRLL